jgi:hypothetical protein
MTTPVDLAHVVALLQRDLADVLPAVRGLRFVSPEEWDAPPAVSTLDGADPLPDDVVCMLGGSGWAVSTVAGRQALLRDVADRLQDEVADALQAAWPSVEVDGRRVVLAVQLDELGSAVWAAPGGPSCPVGYLAATLGRLGLLAPL